MSMRDKAERDKLRLDQWNRDYSVVITSKSVLELLTIADERDLLQAELERFNGAIKTKGGNEHSPTQWAYDQACKALLEKTEELERLRNCVPGDVERLINEYVQLNADWVMLSSTSERVKAFPEKERKYNELLALIGSLIDRKREDLEGAFQACLVWMLTHPHHTVEDCQLAAKAYAERKMKGVKK